MSGQRSTDRIVSLNVKLAFAMFPLILIFMMFSFFVVLRHEANILENETRQRGSSLAASLAIISGEAMRTFSDFQLVENLDQFAKLKDVRYALILNQDGRIVASTDQSQIGQTPDDPLNISAQEAVEERIKNVQFDGQEVMDVAQPILVAGRRLGTVRIGLGLDALRQGLAQSERYLQGLTLILLSGAIIFAALLARWFTTPLLSLARTARKVAGGDLQARAKEDSNDELGLLGKTINRMATRLQTMLEREKTARKRLQRRVHNLLEFAGRVQAGDLTGEAPAGENDEMGQLTMAVNEMVRHLRIILEEERSMRDNLEKSRAELEAANDKLKELDLMKSEFLNTVSHELRTPLTSIKAFAEILLDNVGEDVETQTEFLEIINKESDRLTRLINNLLDLSRIEAGRMKWDSEPVDLYEIAESALNALRGSAEKKGLIVESALEEDLPTVGDKDKLIQVVTNLLGNAIKFTSEGGKILVSAQRKDLLTARICVKDSGVGIAPEFHESVFEKFSQVDSSETRDIKGSGLGLPIARSITEHHGGKLFVESEAGKGSTFIIELPLHLENEESEGDDSDTPLKAVQARLEPGQTVLVVDDEPSIRRFLRHILESEGFLVIESRSGEDAVNIARREKPSLVLLDLVLPDIDGFEVLSRLKEREETKDMPVIILSIIEDEERCFRLGASDYLPKPINRERLVTRVSGLIAAGRGNRPEKEGPHRVLAVDDDDSVLKALSTILTNHGFEVEIARNGKDGLDKAIENPPDLVILDLMMPIMTGHEVLLALKQNSNTAEIPVMILTAAEPDERIRALKGGAESLMTKPFSEKELAKLVKDSIQAIRLPASDTPSEEEKS